MLAVPDIPLSMLISLMDKYGLKSRELKERWWDAHKFWLTNEVGVHHGWGSTRLMDIVFLRVVYACEPNGPQKEMMRLAAAELAAQFRQQ